MSSDLKIKWHLHMLVEVAVIVKFVQVAMSSEIYDPREILERSWQVMNFLKIGMMRENKKTKTAIEHTYTLYAINTLPENVQ